jgi:hypothetical protein
MRSKKSIPIILLLLVFSSQFFSQQRETELRSPLGKQDITKQNPVNTDNDRAVDYKIISSNSSYIEIEFYPDYEPQSKINYDGETFSEINFSSGIDNGIISAGQPGVKSRVFPVIIPGETGNVVTVIDYDVHEVTGLNLAPIPGYKLRDPNSWNFENVEFTFIKDSKAYSQNSFTPSKIAEIEVSGSVRELLMGNIKIHPVQYNPVTKTLKQYTRIRIRLTYGGSPVLMTRKRSSAELELLNGIAVNSDIALNWMNPKLGNIKNNVRVTNSVMNSGDWYKIEIKDDQHGNSEGIYKMTKSYLENAGISLSNVDPRTIKMYGNGGEMVPEDITLLRPEDLTEIAIYIEGENDGVFDPQDYVLFYASSINKWKYDYAQQIIQHQINWYSNSNYYWICVNKPGNGKRMVTEQSPNVPNPVIAPPFTERLFSEPEVNNLINEGNVWLSERKSNGQSFVWNNTLFGLESNSDILYRIKAASRMFCGYTNYMLLKEDNSTISDIYYPMGCVVAGYGDWIWTGTTSFIVNQSQKTNGEQSSFRATYYATTPEAEGYYDWMEIQYKRRYNSAQNDFIKFTSPAETGTLEFNVSPFSNNNIRVFDVSAQEEVKIIQPISVTSNSVKFQRTQSLAGFQFAVSGQNGYKTPTGISPRVPNQNLRGITDGASFIIITHPDLLAAANRLKAKREAPGPGNPDYLKTYVFEVNQIYNEFSGGVLDAVAIRDFIKYCYDNWQEKPVYVCFFGDGDFDYKNILVADANWVPAFEFSDPNINQVNGYTSDDFYVRILGTDAQPDLAHGRIPARSLEEANNYLNKIDCYEDPSFNDYWKNKAVYVADDGRTSYGNDGSQHTDQCEILAEIFTPQSIDKKKLYLVTYPTVITSQGRRKPDCNKDIARYWNEGCIMLNYTGHGSPEVWAHEYVLEKDVIMSQLHNSCRYPFVTIASCDFSKFDNPLSQSGGEQFTMTANKGAIGTIAATRPVYGQQNSVFNNSFWSKLLFPRDTLLYQTRFGKAVFQTKQIYYSVNDLKFLLICDPTLRVQVPRYQSIVDSISGLSNDTMRALSRIKIYGSIMRPDSSFWGDYDGKIFLKIFDVTRQISMTDEDGFLFNFKLPGGIIYSGTQSVNNGKWVAEFIVPKDISYLNQNGKIINYFYNNSADGSGLYTDFIVGGINPNAPVDTTGPDVKLFIDSRNFRSGDVVNPSFKLIGDLFDESGLNTSGTIGHKIEAVLDNIETNKYDLTAFYNSDTTYKSGTLEYDFSNIALGKHSLKLKAWDTYNNSSETEIEFNVSSSDALQVTNVYNYPNPFRDNTAFTFQHNYPNPVNVKIKIYTVAGRLIKEIENKEITDKFVVIDWSGKDEDGETLGNGVYIYKLTVDNGNGQSVTTTGKLAVLK